MLTLLHLLIMYSLKVPCQMILRCKKLHQKEDFSQDKEPELTKKRVGQEKVQVRLTFLRNKNMIQESTEFIEESEKLPSILKEKESKSECHKV